ncbi:MAG: hypothetical protein IPM46_13590 [Flavobacteriales bacterium]|nr:hypothetical protein [Flavobacteriales bacterium]
MRIATLLFACATLPSFADHLPGGSILTRCISGNQHEVTLQLWRECTGVPMINQSMNFRNECGVQFTLNNIPLISVENVSPVCPDQIDQTSCNGGPLIGIEMYTYRTTLFLSSCNYWTISWNTCCRNASVNLNGSQGIYIETTLNNAGAACNASPVFNDLIPPFVCVGQPVSFDLSVTATPGQQLFFRFREARRQTSIDPIVIESVAYLPNYSGAEPFTGMTINSSTGNITFTPTIAGYVVVVVEVEYSDANGTLIGTVMRDFPFVVSACANLVPDAASGTVENLSGSATATGAYALATCGGSFCFDAVVVDGDSEQELLLTSIVEQVLPGATVQYAGTNPVTATICWNADGAALGAYVFTINATDNACPLVGSQTYTYTVLVEQADATAGADASAELCPGETIDLSTLLTGDPGGIWSDGPIVNAPGVYTYTIVTSCGNDEAEFTVNVLEAPDAGQDGVTAVCQGIGLDLSELVSGDPNGSWSNGGPIVTMGGSYTYTVTNACGTDEAVFLVLAVSPPNAGEDNAIGVCQNDVAILLVDSLLGTPNSGGVWTGPDGNPTGVEFNPSTDPPGVYCYTLSGGAFCPDAQACLTISLLPPTDPYCIFLGVEPIERHVRVSPNPSDGLLRIEGIALTRADVLYATGRVAWSMNGSRYEQPSSSCLRAWSMAVTCFE